MRTRIIVTGLTAILTAALLGCSSEEIADRTPRSSASPSPELDKKYPQRARFGMNLASVSDYSNEWALVDAFKASRPWIELGDGKNGGIACDAQGYPRLKPSQSAATLLLRELDGHYPGGQYVATWEGTGKVVIQRWDVTGTVAEKPGRIEFKVRPGDGGIQVEIHESDPKDPVRNIHVWMPGFENAKSPFHPLYLERLEPFGVIRFMDWQKTNKSPLKKWADRPKMTDAHWGVDPLWKSPDKGVPVELMVELANARRCHPWFCMPHEADDDFVRQFARLVKEKLAPDLKPHVEYSNEVWNAMFDQARWAEARGKGMNLGNPDHLRFYSQRAVEIFKIWEEVFGGTDRLVRILSAQFANSWTSEQVLTWKDAYKSADALAVAPYFGYSFGDPKKADQTAKMTPEQLLDALAKEVDGENRELIVKQAKLAQKYKLELIAYEGGQHLAGFGGAENNDALRDLFIAANRSPRMGELYKKHLNHWFDNGGGLYVVFSNVGKPNKWGSWGVLEYQDQPTDKAPKYQALVDFIKKEAKKEK
jgi:hypothetical protein